MLGTSGDTFLGGDDFDERLVEKMVAKFLVDNRIDLRSNEVAMMRLRAVAEQTKIELSRRTRAVVRIDEIAYGPRGAPLNLQIEITRDEFVREIADLVDRTFPVCSEALALANLTIDQHRRRDPGRRQHEDPLRPRPGQQVLRAGRRAPTSTPRTRSPRAPRCRRRRWSASCRAGRRPSTTRRLGPRRRTPRRGSPTCSSSPTPSPARRWRRRSSPCRGRTPRGPGGRSPALRGRCARRPSRPGPTRATR